SLALISLGGFDLRDAGLTVTPDGRLMLNGGACPRKSEKDLAPTTTFVAFSNDGARWTTPKIVTEPDRWLWRLSWHEGKAYGVSYSSAMPASGKPYTDLLVSDDGLRFQKLRPTLRDNGQPTEATVRFGDDGTAYCLQRRDARAPSNTALLGASRKPY